MEVIISTILGICVCASLSLALINCVRCRKKLTEEELQQKYFEKFRKKHMSTRDHVLTNRVDVIRPRSDSQVSSMSCDKEPTYQTISSVDAADSQNVDKDTVDDHSFFDESFQTVVEASSYNTTGHSDPTGNSNLLSASTNLASYISFQQQNQLSISSIPILQIPDGRITPRSGRINPAFSDSISMDRKYSQGNSESDDYIKPNQGPRIIVTKPSIKIASRNHNEFKEHSDQSNCSSEDLFSPECPNDRKHARLDRDMKFDMPCREDIESVVQMKSDFDKLHTDKLRIEGRSFNKNCINSCGGRSKGRTRLVIPRTTTHMSETDSDEEHTYESLSSIIAETNLRRDSVDMVKEASLPSKRSSTDNEHTYESIISKSCESLITSIARPVNEDLPMVNVEEVKDTSHSKKDVRSSSDSDTAVVIIGRKVSWRYKPILPTSAQKLDNKPQDFTNNLQTMLSQSFKSPAKSRRNSLDRYSPFPSSNKKLAFKSPFKQVASPRFSSMQVKSGGHLKPTFLTELLNSASKSIGIENFNIDTPEMKVKDSPKVFTVDSTVFLSPLDCISRPKNTPPVDKDFSPLTFEPTPINDLKTKFNAPIRESLPSLPDDFELVIENHCSRTVNAMSTPTV